MLLEVDMHPFFVIFVCMYVCATHMHHSSSVIILVMCVHSRHVIVLSFASVSCDNVLANAWFACGSDGRRGISLTGDDQGGEGCRISGTRKSTGASACRCALQHAIHS